MKKICLLVTIGVVFLMFFSSPGISNEFKDSTVQELKAMIDSGNEIFILNPLSDIEFGEMHIPGSVNIPLHSISTTDKLPENKNTPVVFYCLGMK